MTTAAVPRARPRPPSRLARRAWLGLLVLTVAAAALSMEIEADRLLRLPAQLWRTLTLMFPPALEYLGRSVEGMVESIQIAWIGTIIGALVSLPLGMLGARNISGLLGSNLIRQLLNAIRAIPELVLAAVIFIPMIGLGPFPGTLAIGVHSIGTLGKLTAEVVEGIEEGPVEAARAAGANRLQILRWGVLPQVLPDILAFWLYRFEINVRASAILGVVGAGGIGTILSNNVSYGRWENVGMTIIVIVISVILIDSASSWLRRRIIEGGGGPTRGDAVERPEFVELAGGPRRPARAETAPAPAGG
jgi:phosphonate transport system permease protein